MIDYFFDKTKRGHKVTKNYGNMQEMSEFLAKSKQKVNYSAQKQD